MDRTAVIILHYQNPADTLDCLTSLLDHEYASDPFRIYVVLNSSEDKFPESLKSEFVNVKVLENYNNGGFAQGNNKGMRYALSEGNLYLILLNNDTVASSRMVRKLVDTAQKNEMSGLISPKIYFVRGYEYHQDRYRDEEKGRVIWYAGGRIDWNNIYASHEGVDEVDNGQYDKSHETDFATGCCMLIKKKAVEKSGFLNEKYFLYYEDVDYSVRIKEKGMDILYDSSSFIYHKNAGSTGKPGSPLHIYYQTRNRLYFGMKYAKLRTKFSLFKESLKLISQGDMQKKAVWDYYFRRMGKIR